MTNKDDDIKSILFHRTETEEEYNNSYYGHLIECYKFFSGTADAVSRRRQSANSFFLSLNTALLALIGYSFRYSINGNLLAWSLIILIAEIIGLALCYLWFKTIKSHKQLNSAKFKIIDLIEKKLPFAPYAAEWKVLGEGNDPTKYTEVTHIEMRLPKLFAVLHGLFGISYIVLLIVLICKNCR